MSHPLPREPEDKFSTEKRLYTWNFKRFKEIRAGQIISLVVGFQVSPDDSSIVIENEMVDGEKVTADISGGTPNVTYDILCTIETDSEKQLTCLGRLYIPL